MDQDRARMLLRAERVRVEGLIAEVDNDARSDRGAAVGVGDIADPAEPLTAAEGDDAVVEVLRARLDAVHRAEQRLEEGTYGRSVRSGKPIPDERLEADPAAELTLEEAAASQ